MSGHAILEALVDRMPPTSLFAYTRRAADRNPCGVVDNFIRYPGIRRSGTLKEAIIAAKCLLYHLGVRGISHLVALCAAAWARRRAISRTGLPVRASVRACDGRPTSVRVGTLQKVRFTDSSQRFGRGNPCRAAHACAVDREEVMLSK